ncbi:hypothetical protein BDD12DRAFT_854601 [Trichophaea hybrida]|nr:hypothetical protein BDD12DRAFT_854601 [Trichophaea hybrida]
MGAEKHARGYIMLALPVSAFCWILHTKGCEFLVIILSAKWTFVQERSLDVAIFIQQTYESQARERDYSPSSSFAKGTIINPEEGP